MFALKIVLSGGRKSVEKKMKNKTKKKGFRNRNGGLLRTNFPSALKTFLEFPSALKHSLRADAANKAYIRCDLKSLQLFWI